MSVKVDQIPQPGDVIYAKRNKHTSLGVPWPSYKHFGIYIGDYQVIHLSGPKGHETDAELADVIQTSLRGFLKGDDLFVQSDHEIYLYDDTLKPYSPDEVILRAKSMLGTYLGKYDLFKNNCEHFANWCRYDKKFCRQLTEVPTRIAKNAIKDVFRVVTEGMEQAQKLSLVSNKENK